MAAWPLEAFVGVPVESVEGMPYVPEGEGGWAVHLLVPGDAEACPDCLLSPLAESTTMVLSPASSEAQVPLKQFLSLLGTH